MLFDDRFSFLSADPSPLNFSDDDIVDVDNRDTTGVRQGGRRRLNVCEKYKNAVSQRVSIKVTHH